MLMSARAMERFRITLCGLSVLGTFAHIMGLVGYFEYKYNMFGITLIHYPHAKAILEGLGIFAFVLLGIGAALNRRILIFIYIVLGGIYLMAHLVCSTVMLKFMVKYFGAGIVEMKGFLITTFGTYILLILIIGSALFYVLQDEESDPEKIPEDQDQENRESVEVAGPATLRAFRFTEMNHAVPANNSHEMIEIVE